MILRIIGSPATGIAGLARTSVSGRRRVPRPAVSTSAWRSRSVLEQHVGNRHAARLAINDVETAIGIDQVIVGRAAERFGHSRDAAIAALDLDKRADRRLVERDDDIVEREFFTILLIAEPDAEAELFENVDEERAVADHGLELLTQLHQRRLHGPLEREQALPRFHAHPQHASPAPQIVVWRVEQAILLQPAASHWRGAGAQDRLARAFRI